MHHCFDSADKVRWTGDRGEPLLDQMSRRVPKTLLSLLLAAAVLAAGGIPPAVRHAHTGGSDLSHRHAGFVADHHSDEDDDACADHHGAGSHGILALGADESHYHFKWLGFQLTFHGSDSGNPTKPGKDQRTWEWIAQRVGRDANVAPASGWELGRPVISDLPGALPGDATSPLAVAGAMPRVTPCLLCDRARHERSGVQLA